MRYLCDNFRCYQWKVRLRVRETRALRRLHDGLPSEKRICNACGRRVKQAESRATFVLLVTYLTLGEIFVLALATNPWLRFVAALFVAVVFGHVIKLIFWKKRKKVSDA